MKRTLPLLITALSGLVLIVSNFIPVMESLGEVVTVWFDILASIAFLLGGGNLLRLHLQKISDQRPGWGYSAVTLVSFLAVLAFGLLKVGSPIQPNVEQFGLLQVPYDPALLPEFRIAGTLPELGVGLPLPGSVARTVRQEGNDIVVRGWLNTHQVDDLLNYEDDLSWKVLVEDLAEAAAPRVAGGKLSYNHDSQRLVWDGYMTDEEEQAARDALVPTGGATATAAIDQLATWARAESAETVAAVPAGFAIPETAAAFAELNNNTLRVRGPVSVGLRDNLATAWAHFPAARPLSPQQQQTLLTELENRGGPLTEEQLEVFESFVAGEWTSELLLAAINSAGAPPGAEKSFHELQAEIAGGEAHPALSHPAPEPVVLNDEQMQRVLDFAANPDVAVDELRSQLAADGPLTAGQQLAPARFLSRQPTAAKRRQELWEKLMKAGPLSIEQQQFLLEGARAEFLWKQEIGRLFIAAHRPKYPWAGEYDAQGTPFWWMYEYVFQPLTATTFAVLAFYVASAAFRAFRAKNLEAILLLGTAFIILLGRTFVGSWMTSWIPDQFSALRIDQMAVYIMQIFNTAGNRAIMIGIALGIVSTSLKVMLGIDRSYLGRGDD